MVAAIAAGVTMSGTRTEAAGFLGSAALNDAADSIALTTNVQYYYGGRNWCWYDDGWQGPGFYWCGYRYRRGFGWGGGAGWRGWGGGPGWRGPGIVVGPGGGGGWMGGGGPMGFGGGGGGGGGGGFMGGGPMGFGGGGGGGPMAGFAGPQKSWQKPGTGIPSDIRLKHEVVQLGQLDNGLGFYRFSYIGSDKAYVGVMGHEVQSIRPDAVLRGPDGYLRVRYDRLGVPMQSYEDWVAAGQKIPAVSH
jgi:hypothetical protein